MTYKTQVLNMKIQVHLPKNRVVINGEVDKFNVDGNRRTFMIRVENGALKTRGIVDKVYGRIYSDLMDALYELQAQWWDGIKPF